MGFLHRILVATDFSPGSRAAADRAARLASQHQAELFLIHATPDWDLFSRWTSASEEHHKAITNRAHDAMRAEVNRLASEFGVHARSEIQLGRASRVITRTAAEYHPDLIVAGAYGHSRARERPRRERCRARGEGARTTRVRPFAAPNFGRVWQPNSGALW